MQQNLAAFTASRLYHFSFLGTSPLLLRVLVDYSCIVVIVLCNKNSKTKTSHSQLNNIEIVFVVVIAFSSAIISRFNATACSDLYTFQFCCRYCK